MKTCETCAHAVFNEKWGEYKCAIYQHTIHNTAEAEQCGYYYQKAVIKKES